MHPGCKHAGVTQAPPEQSEPELQGWLIFGPAAQYFPQLEEELHFLFRFGPAAQNLSQSVLELHAEFISGPAAQYFAQLEVHA